MVVYYRMKTMSNSETQTLTKEALKSSFWVMMFTVLVSPLGYVVRIIFSRSLTTEEYGLFYAVLAFFSFFSTYKDFGFGKACTYYVAKYTEAKKKVFAWNSFVYAFSIEVFSAIIIAVLVTFISSFIAQHFFKNDLAIKILPLFSLYFIFESINISFKNLFVALKKIKYFSISQPIRLIITFILTSLLFLTNNSSLINLVVVWVISYFVSASLYLYFLKKEEKTVVERIEWNFQLFSRLKLYALPNFFGSVIQQINSYTDVLFLTLILGVESVGVYNIIYPIVLMPSMVLSPLTRVFFPIISSLNAKKEGSVKIEHFVQLIFKLIPLIFLYFSTFVFVFAQSSIATLFSYKWVEIARVPLMILVITYPLTIIVSYLGFVIEGMDLVREKVKVSSKIAVFSLLVTPLFLYLFNIIGLIIAGTIVQFCFILSFVKILRKQITIHIPYKLYAKYFMFFILCFSFVKVSGFWPKTLPTFILSGMIYTCIFIIYTYKIRVIDSIIIQTMKELFGNKLEVLKIRFK